MKTVPHENLKAVIFALENRERTDLALDRAGFLVPLVDKPIIQHMIEYAVRCGAAEVDVVVAGSADCVRAIANGGLRWGVTVRVHLPNMVSQPYPILRQFIGVNPHQDAQLLVLHADTFCPDLIPETDSTRCPAVFIHESMWTGMALMKQSDVIRNYQLLADREDFGEQVLLAAEQNGEVINAGRPLSFRGGAAFLESQNRILNREFPELLKHLPTAEPGVWIGRNSRIHPTTRITAPVYLGSNCEIAKGVTLGPGAVVGDDCLIDEHVTVANCLVLPSSSVGEGLNLEDTVICGRKVFNTRINASIDLCDDIFASDLRAVSFLQLFSGLASRFVAICLLPLIWLPVYLTLHLAAKVFRSQNWAVQSYVQTPSPENQFLWKPLALRSWHSRTNRMTGFAATWCDLVLRVIPGLPAVARGELRMIGVTPRTAEELTQMPRPWREMLLAAQTGLISESLVQFGPNAPSDPRTVADLWHTSAPRRLVRVLLLCRYVRSLFVGARQRLSSRTQDNAESQAAARLGAESDSSYLESNEHTTLEGA